MRFLYKRPKIELIQEELDLVLNIMASDLFIMLDLLIFSAIFTLLIYPAISSILFSIGFFSATYGLFCGLYFFIFKGLFEKK